MIVRAVYDEYGASGVDGNTEGPKSEFDVFLERGKKIKQNKQSDALCLTVDCTLEELYRGVKRSIRVKRKKICEECGGTGGEGEERKACEQCNACGYSQTIIQLAPGVVIQNQVPSEYFLFFFNFVHG